jgi:hypothetical protein
MRSLQLLTLAMLATAANAQSYMYLCGGEFAPCTVEATTGAVTAAQLSGLYAALDADLDSSGGYTLSIIAGSDAGIIGDLEPASAEEFQAFFPEGSWVPWVGMGIFSDSNTPARTFDMNDAGVAVGAAFTMDGPVPLMWFDGLEQYGFYGTVIPDPRLALLGIDPATFDVNDGSVFTAINDQGDIGALDVGLQGPSFTYELLNAPIPEPSTLPLFATAGLALLLLHRRTIRKV